MIADLEAVMQEIFLKGAEIKRQAAAERAGDRPRPASGSTSSTALEDENGPHQEPHRCSSGN